MSRTQRGGAEGSPRGHRPEIAHGKHCTELRTRVHAPCERDEATVRVQLRADAVPRFPVSDAAAGEAAWRTEPSVLLLQLCTSPESPELVQHAKFKSSSALITSKGGDSLL